MTNLLKSSSVKYPFDPESYLSKYRLSSPQMALMKSHSYSLMLAGLASSFGGGGNGFTYYSG
jgi:hypothetical protein